MVADIDYQYLIDAATEGVVLFDCGSRSGEESRAQWQGMTWLRWVYARANNGNTGRPIIRNNNVSDFFDNFYAFGESDKLRKRAKSKLRYVCKLTNSKNLDIECKSMVSTLDGEMEELAKLGGFRKV